LSTITLISLACIEREAKLSALGRCRWSCRCRPRPRQVTYIINRATRDRMVAAGWFAEGYGNDAEIMYAPE